MPDSLAAIAFWLLNQDDGTEVYDTDSIDTIDLASKVISEYETTGEGRVLTQFVLSSCGCGGGSTQGIEKTYEYHSYGSGSKATTTVTERYFDGSWQDFRTVHFDLEQRGQTPQGGTASDRYMYLVSKAIIADNGDEWAHRFKYDDSGNANQTEHHTPSSITDYTPYDPQSGTGPSYGLSSDSGLVYIYEYNSDDRLIKQSVQNGQIGDKYLVQQTYWGLGSLGSPWTSSNTRDHLVSKIDWYRRSNTTPDTADEHLETARFFYDFHTSGGSDIKWMHVSAEAEHYEENGPASSSGGGAEWYDSFELFDDRGRNFWSLAADESLTRREYDLTTGALTLIERNPDPDDTSIPTLWELPDSGDLPSSGDFSGRDTDGGSLVTTYEVDLLGRVRKRISPGGVEHYTVREMRPFFDRPDLEYYAVVSLPFEFGSTGNEEHDGPADITFYNANDNVIGAISMTIGTGLYSVSLDSSGYERLMDDYDLGNQLTLQTVTHDVSGLVTETEVWHDIAGDKSYTTEFEYDGLGRLSYSTNPNGTIQRSTYDVLHRVIKTEIGIADGSGDPSDMSTVMEYFFDSGGTATQGDAANGNLTLVRQHVDGSTTRDTEYTYDWRDRRVITENPLAPHSFVVYDNLDRMTEQAVFEDVPTTSEDLTSANTDRGRYARTEYSQRGLVYKQSIAIDPTLADSSRDYLETNTWFDEEGRPVATWGPNGPSTKTSYDGLGRPEVVYTTDRRADDEPRAVDHSGSWTTNVHDDVYSLTTHKAVVTGDVIFEQGEYRYVDDEGLLDLVTNFKRTHDATDSNTGDLSDFSGGDADLVITTYSGTDFDAADRPDRQLIFGTNQTNDEFKYGGTAPTKTNGRFNDGDALIASFMYNDRGLTNKTSTPEGQDTKYLYDDMNRQIAAVENYVNADVSWSTSYTPNRWVGSGIDGTEPDEDRITSFVYDGVSNVTIQTAHMPKDTSDGDRDQVTEYVYGVSKGAGAGDSDIASNDILHKIHYPDESTGNRSTATGFTKIHAFNRLGEVKYFKDQNGTVHDYTRDDLGRLTADKASTLGTDIDGAVRAIGTTYDELGRVDVVHSYDDVAMQSGDIVNAVQFTYTKLWQIEDVLQEPYGDIDGSTLEVTYGYDDNKMADGNWSRLDDLTYPDGESIPYNYGTSGDSNDVISRVFGVAKSGATDEGIQYHYVGLGMTAIVDYADPDVQMDRTAMHNGKRHFDTYTDTPGEYAGYDRYGRVVRHMWVDGDFSNDTSTDADRNSIVELTHTYDDDSNRLTRLNENPALADWPHRDYEYSYDGLDRLIEAERGKWNTGSSSIDRVVTQNGYEGAQEWALDMLGNWDTITVDADADDSYEATEEDDRSHNTANELTDRDFDGTSDDRDYTYDDAGNLRLVKDSSGGVLQTYTHDAWNRLVKVEVDEGVNEQTLSEYEYNGLNWRTIRRVDTDDNDDLDLVREMYYCASWQLREERIDDNADDGGGASIDRHMQYIWGIRYIDDLAFRRENNDFTNDGSGITYEEERYHLHDVQFSTVAVIDETGKMIERVTYDPYGVAKSHMAFDMDGDGSVGVSELLTVLGNWGNNGPDVADVNRDGTVNVSDQLAVQGDWGAAGGPDGSVTRASEDNIVGYDGYLFNAETQQYHVRFRVYAPELGRWIQRDPAGYVDGGNLYEYVRSIAISVLDPFGLQDQTDAITGCNPPARCRPQLASSSPFATSLLDELLTDKNQLQITSTGMTLLGAGGTPCCERCPELADMLHDGAIGLAAIMEETGRIRCEYDKAALALPANATRAQRSALTAQFAQRQNSLGRALTEFIRAHPECFSGAGTRKNNPRKTNIGVTGAGRIAKHGGRIVIIAGVVYVIKDTVDAPPGQRNETLCRGAGGILGGIGGGMAGGAAAGSLTANPFGVAGGAIIGGIIGGILGEEAVDAILEDMANCNTGPPVLPSSRPMYD